MVACNVTPTAIPMFSGSGYTTTLRRELPDVWTNEELNMGFVNRKLKYAIFHSSQIHTSSSLRSISVCVARPGNHENMGWAVRISLLSCLEAEIYIMSFVLPINGRVFELRHTQTSDSIPTCLSFSPDSENMSIVVGTFSLFYVQAEIFDIAYILPVNGAQVWITSHPDVGEYLY